MPKMENDSLEKGFEVPHAQSLLLHLSRIFLSDLGETLNGPLLQLLGF